MSCILYKFPGEVRQYTFAFAAMAELDTGGESLSGVPTITNTLLSGTDTLVISAPSIQGTSVVATISAGTIDSAHKLICTVSTSASKILSAKGELRIRETC